MLRKLRLSPKNGFLIKRRVVQYKIREGLFEIWKNRENTGADLKNCVARVCSKTDKKNGQDSPATESTS